MYAMRSSPLGLDERRYRLSRNSRGLGFHWQHPPARVAKIQSVAQGKIHPSYPTLTSLALGILLFLLSVGAWGVRRVVKEFNEEYASADGAITTPLTDEDRRQVPRVITRKEYEQHRKNAKKSRRLYQH